MKKTTIDTSLLPNVWLVWETTKGNFWLNCQTGEKTDLVPDVDFSWKNKNDILINSGSHPYRAYLKYHSDIDMLEIAAVTIPTTRKEEVKEWKYAGDKYFVKKDKTVLNENGDVCNGPFNLYQYHTARNFKDFLGMFHRLGYKYGIMSEFHKFLGSTDYTIGNGRVVDAQYTWHIQDWYVKKQNRPTNGKQQKLVNTLTDIPLSDVSDFAKRYPVITEQADRWYNSTIISNILYFERMEDGWSVLRMLKRNGDEVVESERMYLHDDGTNRIATKTKNGWIPAKQFRDSYGSYFQFVNKDEAMEKCNRIKYIVPLFESDSKNIKRQLMVALRFPEVEQFIKLGYKDLAIRIANSTTPAADLRHEFGEYYNEKETNLLRKVGMTKAQMDKHLNGRSRNRYWYHGSALGDMRAFFGNDLSHIDINTFNKYYEAFTTIRNQAYGIHQYIESLDLDYRKFIKNAIRLNEKSQTNIFSMIRDTMSSYCRLNNGTQPAIDWYFNAYSDIVRAHDALDALARAQAQERQAMWNMEAAERLKKEEEKRKKIDENRKKYEYEDDNYIIRLPADGKEIVSEGNLQRICIGGYVSRHSLGETNLFFIREKSAPDTPFYAIEMRNNTIVQIHGRCNKWLGCNPEVIPTVVRWLRKNKIKCDEKILTCASTGYCAINQYVPMPVVD